MLLIDNPYLLLEIDDIKFKIRFNFDMFYRIYTILEDKAMCKMFNLEKEYTPLDILEEFNKDTLLLIMCASSNEMLKGYEILKEYINENSEIILKSIYKDICAQYINDIYYIEPDAEENKSSSKENTFEEWFNYYYAAAMDILKMSKSDFLESNPAQIRERIYRKKIIEINKAIEIYNKTHNFGTEENKVVEVENLYDFAAKI